MPLMDTSGKLNPIADVRPATINPGSAPILCPAQGDHVFADVIGCLRTGLMKMIGGGEHWGGDARQAGRFGAPVYSNETTQDDIQTGLLRRALNSWERIRSMELGHGPRAPIAHREAAQSKAQPAARRGKAQTVAARCDDNISEPDNHSHIFGPYAKILQWELCELVYFKPDAKTMCLGAPSMQKGTSWVTAVLNAYDALMERVVDSTALTAYITSTAPRVVDPQKKQEHQPISTRAAVELARQPNGVAAHKAKISEICLNLTRARNELDQMLKCMSVLDIGYSGDKWYSQK